MRAARIENLADFRGIVMPVSHLGSLWETAVEAGRSVLGPMVSPACDCR
jgi:hypothetical protein